MDDLKKQAEDLNIDVDGRWGDERLRAEIDKALAERSAAARAQPDPTLPLKFKGEPVVTILLKNDYWPEEGARRKVGETLDIPVSKAKELIRAGKAERADAMPGEA